MAIHTPPNTCSVPIPITGPGRRSRAAKVSRSAALPGFGEVLAARGVTTVALDDDGVLTRHHPNGSTERLS